MTQRALTDNQPKSLYPRLEANGRTGRFSCVVNEEIDLSKSDTRLKMHEFIGGLISETGQ